MKGFEAGSTKGSANSSTLSGFEMVETVGLRGVVSFISLL